MEHTASSDFWVAYRALPEWVRGRADQKFLLLKKDPRHPSLQFKKIGERKGFGIWSARITLSFRALAIKQPNGFLWFWIGDHEMYEQLIK